MSYEQCWRLIRNYSALTGVQVVGTDGQLRPRTDAIFAMGQLFTKFREGIPLSEVQQQLGHARIRHDQHLHEAA